MDEQQVQEQIVALVQAAMQGDQEAQKQIQQIMLAAQQGDQQAVQLAQLIQQVAQQMQGQAEGGAPAGAAPMGARGMKLNYIRQLRGKCPEGYELGYYKKGGQICKTCMKKKQGGGDMDYSEDPVKNFREMRCGGKQRKMACGGKKQRK